MPQFLVSKKLRPTVFCYSLRNHGVDALIDKISSEVDPEVRTGYYHELQELFYEEGSLINVQVPYLVAINDSVVDYKQPITMLPQYKYMDIK